MGMPTGAIAQVPQIVWSGPADQAWGAATQLELQGTMQEDMFVPRGLALVEKNASGSPRLLPLIDGILPMLRVRVFGVEERVQFAARSEGIRISCGKGRRPAGVVLEAPGRYFPRGMQGALLVRGKATGTAGLSLVRAGADAPAPPQTTLREGTTTLSLHAGASALVVSCPSEAAELMIEHVQVVSNGHSRGSFGTWVWDAKDAIRAPRAFVTRLAAARVDEIVIQAPAIPSDLIPLAHALAASPAAWYLVEGDPDMIMPEGLARTLVRVRLLRHTLRNLPASAAPKGLELDIEPHGRADYSVAPRAAWRNWANAITAIANAWGHPVEVVAPWWMRSVPGGTAALDCVRSSVGAVVVMAYRTDPQLILEAVEPWLATGLPVKVAIEAGEVAPEVQRIYRRASAGTLVITGNQAQLTGKPIGRKESAEAFALAGETCTWPEQVSYHGRDSERRAIERTILPLLASWPNFIGFRVHGLLTATPPLTAQRSY